MVFETTFLNAGLPNLFSPEYDRFASKWDAVRTTFGNPNHWCWSGKRQEWEWFGLDHFSVTDAGLEVLNVDRDQGAIFVFRPLEESWGRVRGAQPEAIWNPRNGGWFTWTRIPGTTPSPQPPLPPVPDQMWTKRLNEELAAIDTLPLSPAERAEARELVTKRYLG